MDNKEKRIRRKKNYKYFCIYLILFALAALSFYCFSFMRDILYQKESVWTNVMYQGFIQLVIVYIVLFASFIITLQFRYMDERKYKKETEKLSKEIIEKNKTIEKLNNEMVDSKLYDTVSHTWSEEYLRTYIHKLCERQIRNFCFIKIKCFTQDASEQLLLHANYVLGKNAITFRIKKDEYIFLFIGSDLANARDEMDYIIPRETKNIISFNCDGYWDKEEEIIKKLQLED